MRFSDERLNDIFDRTDGACHLCGKRLSWSNYAVLGARGAWEVDHSRPRVLNGSNRLNNLYAACISCNRRKQHGSTRSARASHGRTAAPLSAQAKARRRRRNAAKYGAAAAVGAALLGASGPVGLLAVGVGAFLGHEAEPDPQKGLRRR